MTGAYIHAKLAGLALPEALRRRLQTLPVNPMMAMAAEAEQEEAELSSRRPRSPPGEEIIVRADEVDVEGVDISEISSTNDQELEARVEARRQQDAQNPGSPRALANEATGTLKSPSRPLLRREVSAPPPPPRQPPPPAPPTQQDEIPPPADSLSLGQLKSLVANFPKLEPTAYAYTYADTRTFPEELEEWFQYTDEDRGFLARAKESFDELYGDVNGKELQDGRKLEPWGTLSAREREHFVGHILKELDDNQESALPYLEALSYIAMGLWSETAPRTEHPDTEHEHEFEPPNDKYLQTVAQLRCIEKSGALLCELGAPRILFQLLRSHWDAEG